MDTEGKRMNKSNKLFLILLLFIIVIIGIIICCSKFGGKKEYEIGRFSYSGSRSVGVSMGIRSSQNTFLIDDINLELSYGFYNKTYYDKYSQDITDVRGAYMHEVNDQIVIAMYITNNSDLRITSGQEVSEYKNVEGYIFEKEILPEKAFTEEYCYQRQGDDKLSYNHSEYIKLPESIFEDSEGSVSITIVCYVAPTATRQSYLVMDCDRIILKYDKNGESKIHITNLK